MKPRIVYNRKNMAQNNNIKAILMVVCLSVFIVILICFSYQFNVNYSDFKRVKSCNIDPDGYYIFHTKKDFEESATYYFHGKDIEKVIKLDFIQYSYVVVKGAKIDRMYYSVKSTIFDDKSPYWTHEGYNKFCLIIEYQICDGYMYVYQIDRNPFLKSFAGRNYTK